MILDIIRIVIGLAVALFIPGFILVLLYFKEFKPLEKIAFAITFSVMIDIAIAIFLGYNEAQALRTGGLTFQNIIKAEIIVFTILALLTWIKHVVKKKLFKKKNNSKKNGKEITKK